LPDRSESIAMPSPRKTILCIEDDIETAALIGEELVERGFDVDVATDGREGLAAILENRPNLVLCDVSLPFMSGFDVLERLTEVAPDCGYMPFVFLTALTDRENELKGRQLGADDYVTKPIDFDILGAIIDVRLARAPRIPTLSDPVDLNAREIQVLTWAARGKTSAEIAKIINLTKRTVDFHVDNARIKLGVATRIQAAIKATNCRLIEP
jgi:DNA-binding response OmpR family regulator